MTRTLETYKAAFRQILFLDWQDRAPWVKLADGFWSLFRQQM